MSRLELVWLGTAFLLLAGLYVALEHENSGDEFVSSGHRTFELSIGAPHPGEAFPVFKALQGEQVTLKIRSDRPGELNVHGYDKRINVAPGQEVTLTFVAAEAGMYPLHLHVPDADANGNDVTHRHLAVLEVRAR